MPPPGSKAAVGSSETISGGSLTVVRDHRSVGMEQMRRIAYEIGKSSLPLGWRVGGALTEEEATILSLPPKARGEKP